MIGSASADLSGEPMEVLVALVCLVALDVRYSSSSLSVSV